MCFEYKHYGGLYHCWLQMDTNLVFGQLVPIVILTIMALTILEVIKTHKQTIKHMKRQTSLALLINTTLRLINIED
jgi:hypothetical protein